MSESISGKPLWAEMTGIQKTEAVRSGRATLKQLTEGLLDGSDELHDACQAFLAKTDGSLKDIPPETDVLKKPSLADLRLDQSQEKSNPSIPKQRVASLRKTTQRFGLPQGFTLRLQQNGRSVLLEDNIYSLPNGDEFIPQRPTGILGKRRHLYALLTVKQLAAARQGSVYIRTDGRIFDYGVDHADPAREMFDTGLTIHDLERTGRYAPQPRLKKDRLGANAR